MSKQTIIRYYFNPYFNGYFEDGKFFNESGVMLPKKYYNGVVCIQSDRKRFGVKKLKTFAKKHIEIKQQIPF